MGRGVMKRKAVLAAWKGIDTRLRGRVRLRKCDAVSAPALVGWTIWVPEGWRLSESQWRHVLLHEMGHFRRGDLWMQWIGMMVRMVYWWNPLVWLMVRAGEQDREMACDEWVRRQGEEVEAYGGTLVALARWVKGGGVPGAVMMATGRKQLRQRVEAMTGGVAAFWRGGVIGGVVLLGAVALTTRAEGGVKMPWNKGWESPEFRENYRKENEARYRTLMKYGGFVYQAVSVRQRR